MMAPIRSMLHTGLSGIVIEVECHISNGLPSIVIVGLGNKAVDEARERIRSAFASSGIAMPRKRITINLAPADTPKDSTSLDLAIAMAILQAAGTVKMSENTMRAFIGELGLDGNTRGVRGIIGKLIAGKQAGLSQFFIPAANLTQAMLVPNITLYAISTLKELCDALQHNKIPTKYLSNTQEPPPSEPPHCNPFSDIAGQERAKRALVIAAAGGHNILLNGPPGTGKSMLAKALPWLLPPMSREEMLEVTQLHSLVSANYEQLVTERPLRAPHHSTSHIAMIGGGARLRPGEISLSHRGVLFLDEFPEFSRQTVEALRQPLEDGYVTVARIRDSATYPAHFILIATANPCPCGYYGTNSPCECPPYRIAAYRQRLSGPVIDRIDLYANVDAINHDQLLTTTSNNTDTERRTAIQRAREWQTVRFGQNIKLNTQMNNADIRKYAHLESEATILLNKAAAHLRLSARSYMRTIKVSRTIADLADSKTIRPADVTEALQYRPPLRSNLS